MDFKEIKYIKHYLYDNAVEFNIHHPELVPVANWRVAQQGDWTLTDDGYVCQILKRGKIHEKALNIYHDYVRTVCGTFVIQKKNVKMLGNEGIAENIYAFSGNFKAKNTYQKENKMKNKEFLFARYVAQGIDANEAYKKVYPNAKESQYIKNRTSSLLNKESIRTMVKEEIKKVLEEESVTPGWLVGKYRDIIDIGERDSDKLRALDALSKISGLFDTEQQKSEQVTIWSGFSPEQLKEVKKHGNPEIIAHAEKDENS